MDEAYVELLEKIESIARNAPSNLKEELYPNSLGQKVLMQAPELRFTVLSKYEGMGIILKDLGANIDQLESMIEEEGRKTQDGTY